MAELDEQAVEALFRGCGLTDDSMTGREVARVLLQELRNANPDFCVACYYKRKRPTGEPIVGAMIEIDVLARQPQRDGDSGNIGVRTNHINQVLWALYDAGAHGLTDIELRDETGLFLDSSKGCRSGLMTGGWVQAAGFKRRSPRDRPMAVWVLTPAARERLSLMVGPR